jgi:peptidoglycan/xylan/chitin deacetylase (PgdA/CDA1 family)
MQSLRARRAARAAQIRRRRKLAVGGTLTLAIVLVAVVVGLASGGRSTIRRSAAASSRRRSASAKRSASSTEGAAARLVALGNDRIRQLAALGLPIYCGGPHGNEVAFTFDDGPGPYTHYAIKELKQAREHATFFVVGRSMDNFPGWLPRELTVASIGDHTYHHPVLTELPPVEVTTEIRSTRAKIEAAISQPVDLFRPPYGARDTMVDGVAKKLGLLEILWTVDSGDSLGANWAGIIRNVTAGLHPGAIILMHENRGQTIRALRTLLPELRRRHLRSVSLPELFATDPPTEAQVRRGQLGCSQRVRLSSASG